MRVIIDSQHGFSFVELMIVVLIISVLVSMAVPVYVEASSFARSRSCQANQRTIYGAVLLAESSGDDFSSIGEGLLDRGASGWYEALVPHWIEERPLCPMSGGRYYLSAAGRVVGDSGPAVGFVSSHQDQ